MRDTQRPDPDQLLSAIKAEEVRSKRGKLKIFLGACAGVGKSYAMLNAARERMKDGTRVAIGVVETHGRAETMKLLEGIPTIPLKSINHRGIILTEFDIDEALRQKPSLLLVDELAHTNAPTSRHPKRWQDIEELLDAGIDVYTALNVQHLESLGDLVAKITGVWIKETVPDSVFDQADEISLVDIPSEELLDRLKEGKVYIAPGAQNRAMQSFFRKGNLIALREIALRRTAERVDAQMEKYKSGVVADNTPSIGDRIMVAIGADYFSAKLIRITKRIATRYKVAWIAVYVENYRHYKLDKNEAAILERNIKLAEQLGAEVEVLHSTRIAVDLLKYAQERGVGQIVVGKRHRPWWKEMIFGSLSASLIGANENIAIHVISAAKEDGSTQKREEINRDQDNFYSEHEENVVGRSWLSYSLDYLLAIMMPIVVSGFGYLLQNSLSSDSIILLYVIAIVILAMRASCGALFLSSSVSIISYIILTNDSLFNFSLKNGEYILTFAFLFLISMIINLQIDRFKLQAKFLTKRASNSSALYAMTKELASKRGRVNLANIACLHIANLFNGVVNIWQKNEYDILTEITIDDIEKPTVVKEEAVALWAFEHRQNAGLGTTTMPSALGIYIPLIGSDGAVLGVLSFLQRRQSSKPMKDEQLDLLEIFASQTAAALERAMIAEGAERTKVDVENEKLRSGLLASVSHDLRAPIAAITSNSGTLLREEDGSDKRRLYIIQAINNEAAKLARIATSLIDVSNLKSDTITLNRNLHPVKELVGSAIIRSKTITGALRVFANIDYEVPVLQVDGLLIEQVIISMIEKIVKNKPNLPIFIRGLADRNETYIIIGNDALIETERKEDLLAFLANNLDETKKKSSKSKTMQILDNIVSTHGGNSWLINSGYKSADGMIFAFSIKHDAVFEM